MPSAWVIPTHHDGRGIIAVRAQRRAAPAASAFNAHGPDFALAGSYAMWVHGAAEPVHDVDFVVAEADTEAAVATLSAAGFAIARTPENWLFKASADAVVIDVLHRLNGVPVDTDVIQASQMRDVLAIRMPVLSAAQVVIQKLRALNEHYCDFATLLPAVRAVREQVDWDDVRAATRGNDFAAAFLTLTERLGISG